MLPEFYFVLNLFLKHLSRQKDFIWRYIELMSRINIFYKINK